MKKDGFALVFPPSGCFLVLISTLRMLFFLLGGVELRAFLPHAKVFGVVLYWTIMVLCSFFSLPTCGNGIRCCSEVSYVWAGGAWNGFLLGKTKEEDVPCRFCGGVDGDGHFFWIALPPPLFKLGNILVLSPFQA